MDGGTLFRENTSVTKLMTAYAKTVGKTYLVSTLKRLVTLLFSSTEGFEVNPAKAEQDEDLVENLANLMDWCERFVEQVVQTVDTSPMFVVRWLFVAVSLLADALVLFLCFWLLV